MWLIDQIVETRVKKAQDEGQFDHLPGEGEPLHLEDDSMVPEHLRVGYRILKNHGVLPPELEWRKEITRLEDLLHTIRQDDPDNDELRKRLRLLQSQYGIYQERQGRNRS